MCTNKIEDVLEYNGYILDDFKSTQKIDGFDDAVIGVTDDYRLVYDFELMAKSMMAKDGVSYREAVEYIDCNIIGYTRGDLSPVIIERMERENDGTEDRVYEHGCSQAVCE